MTVGVQVSATQSFRDSGPFNIVAPPSPESLEWMDVEGEDRESTPTL